MTWYETERGDLLNLDKVTCISINEFDGRIVHFTGTTHFKLSETDYENIKNILLNNGGK